MEKRDISTRDVLKYIFVSMGCISLIILVVGLFVSDRPLAFTLGLLYGAVISAVRVLMLASTINKSVDMEAAQSKTYVTANYHARMLFTIFAVVIGAVFREYISIAGIIFGLLAMQPAVYISNIIYTRLGGERFDGISFKKADRHS